MFFITIRSDVCGAIQALIAPKLFMPAWLLDNRQFEGKNELLVTMVIPAKNFFVYIISISVGRGVIHSCTCSCVSDMIS